MHPDTLPKMFITQVEKQIQASMCGVRRANAEIEELRVLTGMDQNTTAQVDLCSSRVGPLAGAHESVGQKTAGPGHGRLGVAGRLGGQGRWSAESNRRQHNQESGIRHRERIWPVGARPST